MSIAKNGTTGPNGTGNTKVYVTLSGYSATETVSVDCLATQSTGDGSGTVDLGAINVVVGSDGSKASTYVCQYASGPYAQVRDQYGTHSNIVKVP